MSPIGTKQEEIDEYKLIRSVLRGHQEDFAVLVRTHQQMIFNLIKRQVRDEAAANDLLQETFIRAYGGLKKFKFQSKFSTWLTRIALNVTNSYFSSRRYKEFVKNVPLDHAPVSSSEDMDSSEPDFSAQQALLQFYMGSLKPKFRDVLVLCALEEKSYAEAADILGIPVGTVCSRMNTALTTLRDKCAHPQKRRSL